MGRNGQPVDLLVAKGKKHLTKAEIESRKENEIKLGSKKLTCPEFVKNDVEAYKKWKEILKIYKDVDFVSSGDIGLLSRYCKTFSEYQELLKAYQRVKEIHYDSLELDDYLDEFDEEGKSRFGYKIKKQLRDIFSISGILSVETAINKKMDMLIKMEDRLFLNPLAKIKNVPKPTKNDDVPQSKWSKYGG